MRDAGGACLAHGGERRGERGVVRSRVSRPRSAGESEGASLRGAARVGEPALARPKLWASAAGESRLHPSPRLLPKAGGVRVTTRTVLSPRAPPHVGRRGSPRPLRFSPRVGPGRRVSSSGNRAAVWVAQRPRRPDSAVQARSVAGDRAAPGLLQENAAPDFPLWRPGHAWARGAAGPSARTVPAIAGFRPVPGDEGLCVLSRLRHPFAPPHLSFQCRVPGGKFRSSLCYSGGGSDSPKRAARGLRDRPLRGAVPAVAPLLREALGRRIASSGCASICGGDPGAVAAIATIVLPPAPPAAPRRLLGKSLLCYCS